MLPGERIHSGVKLVGRLLALLVLLVAGIATAMAQPPQQGSQQVSQQQIARDNDRLSRIKDEMDILRAPSNAALSTYLSEIGGIQNDANSCIQYVQTDQKATESELATLGPAKKGEPADVTRKRASLTAEKTKLQGEIASCRLLLEKIQELTGRITQLQHLRVGELLVARGPGLVDIVRANLADPGHLWSTQTASSLADTVGKDLSGFGRQQQIALGGLLLVGLAVGFGLRRLLLHQARTRAFQPSLRGRFYRSAVACGGRYLLPVLVTSLSAGFFAWQGGDNPSLHFVRLLSCSLTLYFIALALIRALLEPCLPATPYWPLPAASLGALSRGLRLLALLVLLGFVGSSAYETLVAIGLPAYPAFLLIRKLFFLLLVGNLVWITALLGRLPFLSGTRAARFLLIVGLLVSLAAAWDGYSNLATYVFRGILVTLLGLALVLILMRVASQIYDGLDAGRHRWQRRLRRAWGIEPGIPLRGLIWFRILTGMLLWGGFMVLAFYEWNPLPINALWIHLSQFGRHGQTWLVSAGALIGAMIVGLVGYRGLLSVVRHASRHPGTAVDDSFLGYVERPLRALFPLVAILLALPALSLPPDPLAVLHHLVSLALIAAVAWLLVGSTSAFGDFIAKKYGVEEMDNLRARRIRTQSQVFRRISIMGVGFVTLAIMLMTFPNVRHVGVSLFASAGVAGLVAGLAARPVLTNLIAGVQIALTEPVRIDDVVIVEGEWGRIEEIAMTYVVVRIWDLRRLVVPLSYFIEKPFQNWTRAAADLLGTVYIYTDYCVPVDEVRKELRRILETSGMWDGRVCVLQVTNSTDRAMELRALMSAPNSGAAWDLRCYVRERLIQFVRERYPESLPRTRAEVQGALFADASDGDAAVLAAAARG